MFPLQSYHQHIHNIKLNNTNPIIIAITHIHAIAAVLFGPFFVFVVFQFPLLMQLIVIVKQMQIILFYFLQHTHTHISFFHCSTHCCIHSHKCNSFLLLISPSLPSSFTTTTATSITNTITTTNTTTTNTQKQIHTITIKCNNNDNNDTSNRASIQINCAHPYAWGIVTGNDSILHMFTSMYLTHEHYIDAKDRSNMDCCLESIS